MLIPGGWEVYSYTYGDGMVAVISFDVESAEAEEHADHPHGRRVIAFLPEGEVSDNGLPSQKAVQRLDALEDGLLQALRAANVEGRFVGRMTYGGMREFVFQVTDAPGFARALTAWRDWQNGWRIETREREGWGFFDEKVRPSANGWRQIADRRVIDQLLQAGTDPDREHVLEHFFDGPVEALRQIAAALAEDGFAGEVDEAEGRLMMARAEPLDLPVINRLTTALAHYSEGLGAHYDGWGTPVLRDEGSGGPAPE
jgi:regulator of RNase E activity RraB